MFPLRLPFINVPASAHKQPLYQREHREESLFRHEAVTSHEQMGNTGAAVNSNTKLEGRGDGATCVPGCKKKQQKKKKVGSIETASAGGGSEGVKSCSSPCSLT